MLRGCLGWVVMGWVLWHGFAGVVGGSDCFVFVVIGCVVVGFVTGGVVYFVIMILIQFWVCYCGWAMLFGACGDCFCLLIVCIVV